MAETLDLTTPIAGPTITGYRVAGLELRKLPSPLVRIRLVDTIGQEIEHRYEGEAARVLLTQLNTMNFTNTSLEKRILQKLITDGVLSGTVNGTPD